MVRIGTFNVLNLRAAGRPIYGNPGYTTQAYRGKIAWTAGMLDRMDCQLVALQEVFDRAALDDLVASSTSMRDAALVAGPAPDDNANLPRVALVSTLRPIGEPDWIEEIPPAARVTLPGAPELGLDGIEHTRFSRPVLRVAVDLGGQGRPEHATTVYVVHLKSRQPKRLERQVDGGRNAEDLGDPAVEARAHLRALLMRAAEATGIRLLALEQLHRQRKPVIVLGDFNDHARAITTSIVAGRLSEGDLARRDIQLYDATTLRNPSASKHTLGYTNIHLGEPGTIDHVLVSEEFNRDSRYSIAEVERVDYLNDHLADAGPLQSDHGAVRVVIRLR